jgi:FkbM family methyltransferase
MSGMELLQEKRMIESRFDHGADQKTTAAYISLLAAINRQFCGILDFRWPGVPTPLFMRCGSSDLSNFIQIFCNKEYGFPISFSPRRILDLGAYAGFASTFLALRFPDADIVSVEPSAANFQILALNTGAYSRIRRLNVAVWGHSSTLDVTAHSGGDWGTRLVENGHRDGAGGIPALSVEDILAAVKWESVDFLKCDIEGAEASVFAESGARIAGLVNCCAIEIHDVAFPRCREIVAGCFDPKLFSVARSGEFDVFLRRDARDGAGPAASRISLFRPAGGPRGMSLKNVPAKNWAYYMFDVDSCQLHPNNRGEPVAEISTALELGGQTVFDCEVSVANPLGHSVDFIVEVHGEAAGRPVARSEITVRAGEKRHWTVPLSPAAQGRHQVFLRTTMSAGSPTSHQAVANWIAPAFAIG